MFIEREVDALSRARRMFIHCRLCKFTCHCRNNNAYERHRKFLININQIIRFFVTIRLCDNWSGKFSLDFFLLNQHEEKLNEFYCLFAFRAYRSFSFLNYLCANVANVANMCFVYPIKTIRFFYLYRRILFCNMNICARYFMDIYWKLLGV